MIKAIDGKREALGINKKQDRVLFDMEMRRDLDAGDGISGLGCGHK
jgi:carbon-monoxide dehydrogenase catalytic subunit